MEYQASFIFETELTPKKGVKIPFGVHEKCKVRGIDVTDEYVDLNFEDSEGRYNNKRLWLPKGTYPKTTKLPDGSSKVETTEEARDREEKLNLAHVVKLLHIFLGKEGLSSIKAGSYHDFMQKAAKALSPDVLSSKLVNLKLIYDAEGVYAVFGNFPDYVELHIEGQAPTLKYTEYEQQNRCKPAAARTAEPDPLTMLLAPKAA